MQTRINHYSSLDLNADGLNSQGLPYAEIEIRSALGAAYKRIHKKKNHFEEADSVRMDHIMLACDVLLDDFARNEFDASLTSVSTTQNLIVCRLHKAGLITLQDIEQPGAALKNIFENSTLSVYILKCLDTNIKINLSILSALPTTHSSFYFLINAGVLPLAMVLQLHPDSFEFKYYKKLKMGDKQRALAALHFYSSAEFNEIRNEFSLNNENIKSPRFNALTTRLAINASLVDFSNESKAEEYQVVAENKLNQFYLEQGQNNPVSQKLIANFKKNNLDIHQLNNYYGKINANLIISLYLRSIGFPFFWPTNINDVRKNLICRLVLRNKLSLSELTSFDNNKLNKLKNNVVDSYLDYLLKLDRKIPLTKLFALRDTGVKLFPLVANNVITIEQANQYTHKTIVDPIFEILLIEGDWDSNCKLQRLKFIWQFLQSEEFARINHKILKPINKKINSLSLIHDSKLAKLKMLQMTHVREAIANIIYIHFRDAGKSSAIQDSFHIDKNKFTQKLNLDLYKTVKSFVNAREICKHRNLISHFLQMLLTGLTWFIKPLLSEKYRHRLFSTKCANTLQTMEDDLEKTSTGTRMAPGA
jgi:hypothetical protein